MNAALGAKNPKFLNLNRFKQLYIGPSLNLLEYRKTDPLENGQSTLTWWTGENYMHCWAKWEITFSPALTKIAFRLPSSDSPTFLLIRDKLYYIEYEVYDTIRMVKSWPKDTLDKKTQLPQRTKGEQTLHKRYTRTKGGKQA